MAIASVPRAVGRIVVWSTPCGHRDGQQQGEAITGPTTAAQHGDHVVDVRLVGQPDPRGAEPRVGLDGDRDQQ